VRPSNQINDRNVREALDILEGEFHSMEQVVDTYEDKIDKLENILEDKDNHIEDLKLKVKSLEEALAEAYLTSEADSAQK